MLITLARSWSDPATSTEYGPDQTVEVDAETGRQLLQDGRARAAGRVIEDAAEALETVSEEQPARSSGDELVDAPPQSGRGSGRDAWVAYATAHDVAVGEETTRDEIIASLEAAGVPVESAQQHIHPESPNAGDTSEGVS